MPREPARRCIMAARKALRSRSGCIGIVSGFQPLLHFAVDVLHRRDGDAVSDAVLLGIAASVDEAALGFSRPQSEAEIDARLRGGLDLREDVMAIERNHGLEGARLHVF